VPVQVLYSFATQRFSRAALFNAVVAIFLAWFVFFGLAYPSHEAFHFHGLAESALERLPSGLAGAVGMVRTFSNCLPCVQIPMLGCNDFCPA
jgi:ATP/ADP translocase